MKKGKKGRTAKPGRRDVLKNAYAMQLRSQHVAGAAPRGRREAQDEIIRAGRQGVEDVVALVSAAHEAKPGCGLPAPVEVLRLAEEALVHQRAVWASSSTGEATLHALRALMPGARIRWTAYRARIVLALTCCRRDR